MKSITTTLLLSILFIINSISVTGQTLTDSLVGYYKMDLELKDNSPLNIFGQGTDVFESEGLPDSQATGMIFNGHSSFINLSNSDRNILDKLTLSIWIKTLEDKRQFVISDYISSEDRGFFLATDSGKALIGGRDNNGQFWECKSDVLVNDDEWHHIFATIDNNVWSISVDCEPPQTIDSGNQSTDINSSEILTLGVWLEGISYNTPRYFNGLVDEFRMYNRVLQHKEKDKLCDIRVVTNIDPDPLSNEYKINVSSNEINISVYKNTATLSYLLTDSFNNKIDSGKLVPKISIHELSSGIYNLTIIDKNRIIQTTRFLKLN